MAKEELRVAMIGYAFMGRTHSHAWRSVAGIFDLPLVPRMAVICGRDEGAAERARQALGWDEAVTDWRVVVERADIDVVDICTPGASHVEIAVAALDAGKHVLCEKPMANTVEEAERMAEAAARAARSGVRSMVAFNYRRVPATALARSLIAAGRLGEIRHVRASYLQDWAIDPELPLLWRFVAEEAGTGALGDMASHIVDLAQFLVGDRVERVSAITETFIEERPLLAGAGRGRVTVDDAAAFVARFAGGALATFEVSRLAPGRKNALRLEINGSAGSVGWGLETMNELDLYLAEDEGGVQGFRRILVTEPEHPWIDAWWPPGHIIGWEHAFTHEVRDLVRAIASDEDPEPSFADGLQVQRVLGSVVESARDGSWKEISG
jgi:predicted dehydrogenase